MHIGQYIKTVRGPGLVTSVDLQTMQVVCTVDHKDRTVTTIWVDMETIIDDDVLDADLRDIDTVEKYLSGDPVAPEYHAPQAAVTLPCQPVCGCTWCNQISSNGFHMYNAGACMCEKRGCKCLSSRH